MGWVQEKLGNNGSAFKLEGDVLICGAGAAGCLAAIGAVEHGCSDVIIVDKGRLEGCGCCGAGQDHFSAHLNSGPDWDSDDAATKWYSTPGWGVSPNLVEKTFTRHVGGMVNRLESLGIEFFKDEGGSYYRTQALGQPGPWWMMMKNGKYVKRKLAAKVRSLGVNVLDHVMIIRLLSEDNIVSGAVGLGTRSGNLYIISARTVIFAMGSHQSRWSTNSTGNPFNIWQNPANTGSNVIVGYDIGAKVKNLEMCVATILPKGFGAPAMNAFGGMNVDIVNALGESFMKQYHPLGPQAPRGSLISGFYEEAQKGKDPFFIDARHIPEKDMMHLINNLLSVDKDTFGDYLAHRRIDLRKDLLEVEIGEFSGGGNLLVDDDCQSNVKGLFGLPFSGMLSTAMCGGYAVGAEAAEYAKKHSGYPRIQISLSKEDISEILAPLARSGSDCCTPREFADLIRQIMRYYMGYVRNQRKMELALQKLRMVDEHVSRVMARNLHELVRTHETAHLLRYCELMVQASLAKKGVKGFYKRSDNVNRDKDDRFSPVVLWRSQGQSFTELQVVR